MTVIVLHGPPGVGKLAVGRELQKLTGYRLFHNHLTVDMVASVFDFHSLAFRELRERFWLDVLGRAAEEGLPGVIFTLVFEPTVLPGFYERLVQRVQANGGIVQPVQLSCSNEENARRVVQPDRRSYMKEMNVDFLRAALERGDYNPPSDLQGNVMLDTTNLGPQEAAKLIVIRLDLSNTIL
jgi:hypothetical protein